MLRKELKQGQLFHYHRGPDNLTVKIVKDGEPFANPNCYPVSNTKMSCRLDDIVILHNADGSLDLPSYNTVDPAHYKDLTPEPVLVMEGWGLDRNLSNVIKYVARAGRKDSDAVGDLKKARKYLTRAINLAEGRSSWDFVE